MIPLTADQVLEVQDKTGRIYKLKYLTELDNQVEYLGLSKQEQTDRKKFRDKAKAELPKNATEEKINLRAYELVLEERERNPKQHLSLYNSYIDIFVASWSGDGLLPFPKSGKPSTAVRLFEKFSLYRLIQDNIEALTGLSLEEIKN